jgi:hypothetical protein
VGVGVPVAAEVKVNADPSRTVALETGCRVNDGATDAATTVNTVFWLEVLPARLYARTEYVAESVVFSAAKPRVEFVAPAIDMPSFRH